MLSGDHPQVVIADQPERNQHVAPQLCGYVPGIPATKCCGTSIEDTFRRLGEFYGPDGSYFCEIWVCLSVVGKDADLTGHYAMSTDEYIRTFRRLRFVCIYQPPLYV